MTLDDAPGSREVGTLATTPLPQLLTTLADTGRTGRVEIDGGSEIWLVDGRISLASTPTSPSLEALLYGAGLAGRDDIRRALDPSAAGVLDALLDANPDAVDVLNRVVHEHSLNAVFEMLVPSDAAYRVVPEARNPLEDRFAEDTVGLLELAQQRVERWRRIAATIPSTAAAFRLAPRLGEGVEERVVTADEWRYLAMLDGTMTVAEMITRTGESAFRVCSTLYRLTLEGVVEEAR
ncbi:MAG: DUF4388 domain-containing protein [Acidimicrobiales bacterium]